MCTRMCCASLVLFIVYAVARSNPPLTCMFLWDISEVTEQLIKKSFPASFLRVQPTNAYESAQRGSLSVTTSNKVFIRILCVKTWHCDHELDSLFRTHTYKSCAWTDASGGEVWHHLWPAWPESCWRPLTVVKLVHLQEQCLTRFL